MKQHKMVNINVKVKLTRIPTSDEKMKLVEKIASLLDHDGLYGFEFKSGQYSDSLMVDHHYVNIRKMGR